MARACKSPPLTNSELDRIKRLNEMRFDANFWATGNIQTVIRRLLSHIRHQQAVIEILKIYIWEKEIENGQNKPDPQSQQ